MRLFSTDNGFNEEVFFISDKTGNSFFDIDAFGTTNPDPAYGLYLNPHGSHVFEYVVSGSGYIDFPGEHIRIEAGDFYFIKKGFVGHYYADHEDPYCKIWINANGNLIASLASAFGINSSVYVSHSAKRIGDIIRRVHERLKNGTEEPYNELLQRISGDIFEIFSAAKAGDVMRQTEFRTSMVTDMKRHINSCIYSELSLEALAAQYHMNPSYLIRKFKSKVGITPMRYYNLCKIEAARSMLIYTPNRSVKTVAAALKYADAAYFSGCFKAETGYAPSEYTKEIHLRYLESCKSPL